MRLNKQAKYDAHRVISNVAIKLAYENKIYGSATDINGNTYIFEIFGDLTYRIINIEVFNKNVEEVINEKYSERNC